jgi:hypothetical protein
MSVRNDEKTNAAGARTLEPVAGRVRTGQPACYRVRRVVEPAPKQPSRLLFLPPVWTRASFWLPLGRFAAVPQRSETPSTDPQDDYAA